MEAKQEPGVSHWPQGTCPKPWVATVDGQPLRDGRKVVKRYASHLAALKAAKAAIAKTEAA